MNEIFTTIEAAPPNTEFLVKVSYVEVYMERIRDLLDSRKDNLRLREDPRRGVWLEDVSEMFVGSPVRRYFVVYVIRMRYYLLLLLWQCAKTGLARGSACPLGACTLSD